MQHNPDLLAEVNTDTQLKRVASTNGGEYAGPCPFCGGKDRFRVWPERDGGRWWCRQCERSGDTIAYLSERGDITPQEAGRLRRAGGNVQLIGKLAPSPRKETKRPGPVRSSLAQSLPPAQWRERAWRFVEYCQEQLFTNVGRDGLDWLHRRGLTDETIRAWRLGWHDRNRWRDPGPWGLNNGKKIWLAEGVVIPWIVKGDVWHVKTRRFDDELKYIRVRGGQPTLYGLDRLTGRRKVVICEGELDAVLLWQEAGDLVDVVAIGSKGSRPPLSHLFNLVGASQWLVALDNDAEVEARKWGHFSNRVKRACIPEGNDLTEFYQTGGDLRTWIFDCASEVFGSITPPGEVPSRATVTLSLPADTSLGVPEDPERWKRRNGRIVATYTRDELTWAVILALRVQKAKLEDQLECGLNILERATGCVDDAEAERLRAHWDAVSVQYHHLSAQLAEVMEEITDEWVP